MATSPDQQQNVTVITKTFTLAAGVPQKLLTLNTNRRFLLIQNVGTAVCTVKEDSPPVAGSGLGLDPPSVVGGQGGSWNPVEIVPVNELWAISASGTVLVVIEA